MGHYAGAQQVASAGAACAKAVGLMDNTLIEPTNAGYRGYMAGAYSDVGEVYDSLAAKPATPSAERRDHRLAALKAYRRSSADTGRVTAAARALARAEAALR